MCNSLAVFGFNFILLVLMVPVWVVSAVGLCIAFCVPKSLEKQYRRRLAGAVIRITWAAWNSLFCLCRWIRIDQDWYPDCSQLGATGRPVCLIMNHASFLDILLSVSMCPYSWVGDVKMMASNHLFKTPFLGQILRAMGHLDVPFKVAANSDKFEIDKEEMVERMALFEEHLLEVGCIGWFPEGRMNRGDPHCVETFRAGGFDVAVKNDVEIWCIINVGNTVCWPRKAAVGGRPASIGVKVFMLCESSHDYIHKGMSFLARGAKEDSIFVADSAQRAAQKAIDDLVAEGYSGHEWSVQAADGYSDLPK